MVQVKKMADLSDTPRSYYSSSYSSGKLTSSSCPTVATAATTTRRRERGGLIRAEQFWNLSAVLSYELEALRMQRYR